MSNYNILENHRNVDVNGTTGFYCDIPGGAKKFQFWYKVEGWSYNDKQNGNIEFHFEHTDETTYVENSDVYFPITENVEYGHVDFEIPNMAKGVNVFMAGTFKAESLQLYPDNTKVDTATTVSTGIVRPTASSAISVVEVEEKDENGNIIARPGDIDVKVSDDFDRGEDGTLFIKSGTVSRTSMNSMEFYSDGFGYNGEYGFQWMSSGNIYNCNTGKIITVSQISDSVLNHIKPPATTGEEGSV